jgi:hypothetical protein
MDGGPLVDIAAVASTLCFHDMSSTDAVLPSRVPKYAQIYLLDFSSPEPSG